jgi:hypothetical protein
MPPKGGDGNANTFFDTPIQPSRLDTKRAIRNTTSRNHMLLPARVGCRKTRAASPGGTSEKRPVNPSQQNRYRMKAARHNRS